MRYANILFLIYLSTVKFGSAQIPKFSSDYLQSALSEFEQLQSKDFYKFDFSKILSNQERIELDPWSSYIGVFGSKNRRIDFHLTAEKVNDTTYKVGGKSRMGSNVRELNGIISLKHLLKARFQPHIVFFEYDIKEPGDRDGDGHFIGIGAFSFNVSNNVPEIFWAESGDYREYNNMFIGSWINYGSGSISDCIFSFEPSGTNTRLPFRDDFYEEFDEDNECKCFFRIKEEFRKYGWQDYDDDAGDKRPWWKN